MLFNSYIFIVFFAMVLAMHYSPLSWKAKKISLLLASYLFYAAWNPPFILLLWFTTALDFFLGRKLFDEQRPARRKALLLVSLVVNLGMLSFFKYGSFLLENFVALTNALGFDYHPAAPSIVLPVGISFYTFQSLSYTLDMYKRSAPPERSLLDFSLFVTFFPQLVAGPIVRPGELAPQFKTPHYATGTGFLHGLLLISLGLFMKVVMADTLLAGAADTVFGASQSLLALDAWAGVLAFAGQIFFDFAGYSTCAIGAAATLGFTLPDNFRYPYAATGFSDFWRRWHITLSTWLRDYLYIPLGGNRRGKTRTYINLMLTMLLGGLWHGASWTFVVWGALHGLFLCIEKYWQDRNEKVMSSEEPAPSFKRIAVAAVTERASLLPRISIGRLPRVVRMLLVFVLVNVTWVFFRAEDFSTAGRLLGSLFGFAEGGVAVLPTLDLIKVGAVTILLLTAHWLMRDTSVMQVTRKAPWWLIGTAWALLLVILALSQKSSDSFLYFQF